MPYILEAVPDSWAIIVSEHLWDNLHGRYHFLSLSTIRVQTQPNNGIYRHDTRLIMTKYAEISRKLRITQLKTESYHNVNFVVTGATSDDKVGIMTTSGF